jgi:hypothetical protein
VSRDGSVVMAMGYELDGRDSISCMGNSLFSTPQRPDLLLGPPSLQSNGYGQLFSAARGLKLTAHLQLVQRSRKMKLYLYSSIRLHGTMLNSLSTGTTLPYFFPNILTMAHSRRFILAILSNILLKRHLRYRKFLVLCAFALEANSLPTNNRANSLSLVVITYLLSESYVFISFIKWSYTVS